MCDDPRRHRVLAIFERLVSGEPAYVGRCVWRAEPGRHVVTREGWPTGHGAGGDRAVGVVLPELVCCRAFRSRQCPRSPAARRGDC